MAIILALCSIISLDFDENNAIQPKRRVVYTYLTIKNIIYFSYFLIYLFAVLIPYSLKGILLEMDSSKQKLMSHKKIWPKLSYSRLKIEVTF